MKNTISERKNQKWNQNEGENCKMTRKCSEMEPKRTKMEPKGTKMEPKVFPKQIQMVTKCIQNVFKMGSKWVRNGSKINPKWVQNGSNWVSLGVPRGARVWHRSGTGDPKGAKSVKRSSTLGSGTFCRHGALPDLGGPLGT